VSDQKESAKDSVPIQILPFALAFPQNQSEGVIISPSFSSAHCRQIRIYAVSKGWHAGLVVPSERVNCAVPELEARFVGATHYEIGWGDQGFYQAKKATLRLAFQALFASRGSVMHVVPIRPPLPDFLQDREVAETCLTASEYASLVRLISESFARNANGQIIPRERGACGDSQFFQGRGAYNVLYTCNRWTATALRSAGLDLWPRITLTSGSVMRAVRKYAKSCSKIATREVADDPLQMRKP
jgi:uncharacterized protein (TIGR02117 family)